MEVGGRQKMHLKGMALEMQVLSLTSPALPPWPLGSREDCRWDPVGLRFCQLASISLVCQQCTSQPLPLPHLYRLCVAMLPKRLLERSSWETAEKVISPSMPPGLGKLQLLLHKPELNKYGFVSHFCPLLISDGLLICVLLVPMMIIIHLLLLSAIPWLYRPISLPLSLKGTKCLHPSLFQRLCSLSVSYCHGERWWCLWTQRLTCFPPSLD